MKTIAPVFGCAASVCLTVSGHRQDPRRNALNTFSVPGHDSRVGVQLVLDAADPEPRISSAAPRAEKRSKCGFADLSCRKSARTGMSPSQWKLGLFRKRYRRNTISCSGLIRAYRRETLSILVASVFVPVIGRHRTYLWILLLPARACGGAEESQVQTLPS